MSVLWAEPILGGSRYRIIITDSTADPELPGNQGLCKDQQQTIFINRDEVGPRGYWSIRFHEEFHACGVEHGGRYAIQQFLGIDDEKMEALDELIVRTYGQAMFAYQMTNGYLKYEDIPMTEDDARKDPVCSGLPSSVRGPEGVEVDDEGWEGAPA